MGTLGGVRIARALVALPFVPIRVVPVELGMADDDEIAAIDETLAARIRRLREARGLTQAELARAADVTKTHVWQIEHGARQRMRLPTLTAYARALGVTTYELQEGKPEHTELTLEAALRRTTKLTERQVAEFCAQIRAVEHLNEHV